MNDPARACNELPNTVNKEQYTISRVFFAQYDHSFLE